MEEEKATEFERHQRNQTYKKLASNDNFNMLKNEGLHKGGNIYAIDHDEMLKLAFKNFLNPENDGKKIQLDYVWARMPTLSRWKRYSARHEDGCILFCKNVRTNEFSYCYALYNCQFQAMRI